jgi:tRNA (pseudouridine54-N1)-methyltransferase
MVNLEQILGSLNRVFVLVGNVASTGDFNLSDLPGSGGRMDLVCRFVAQSLLISHGIRKDSAAIAILKGEPDPPRAVLIHGGKVRYLAPDERNVAGLLRKAIEHGRRDWKETSPGIFSAKRGLKEILEGLKDFSIVYLDEGGRDVSTLSLYGKLAFILGDHLGVGGEDESLILRYSKEIVSVSPIPLQADQCVVIVHNFLDRRESHESKS